MAVALRASTQTYIKFFQKDKYIPLLIYATLSNIHFIFLHATNAESLDFKGLRLI